MRGLRIASLLVATSCVCGVTAWGQGAPRAQTRPAVIDSHNPENRPEQRAKHYLVLVSLSGFRSDYAKRYGAPHLDAMAKRGTTAAAGMVPAYPAATLPNAYTLVTGLSPQHHGIVADSFYDPVRKQHYRANDPATVADGSWYRGVPLWSLAEQQGMRSASLLWPGSGAIIAGQRPSYSVANGSVLTDEARIALVSEWLELPEEKRPHFIAVDDPEVAEAGRRYGPEAPETRTAVHRADALIGALQARLAVTHLPVDLVVVSDHGMAAERGDWINLEQYVDLGDVETAGALLYPPTEQDAARIYSKLRIATNTFMVYRRSRMPASLNANDPRMGDPAIVPTGPYAIRAHAPADAGHLKPPDKGVDGYDPHVVPEMRAIFYAEGPDIRASTTLQPFDNVNVFPLLAAILQLRTAETDGSAAVLAPVLTAPEAAP